MWILRDNVIGGRGKLHPRFLHRRHREDLDFARYQIKSRREMQREKERALRNGRLCFGKSVELASGLRMSLFLRVRGEIGMTVSHRHSCPLNKANETETLIFEGEP